MTEVSGNSPINPDPEKATYAIADGRIQVNPAEHATYVDGTLDDGINGRQFQVLSMLAERAGHLVSAGEICEKIWQRDSEEARPNMAAAIIKLQQKLGPVLGHPQDGAVRVRPYYGVWAAKTLAHRGVVPLPENDSPVRVLAGDRLSVYPDQAVVMKDGEVIEDLAPTEYELLAELARRPGRIVAYSLLREASGIASRNALGSHISSLRKKLGDDLGDSRQGAIIAKPGGYVGQRLLKPAGNLSTGL